MSNLGFASSRWVKKLDKIKFGVHRVEPYVGVHMPVYHSRQTWIWRLFTVVCRLCEELSVPLRVNAVFSFFSCSRTFFTPFYTFFKSFFVLSIFFHIWRFQNINTNNLNVANFYSFFFFLRTLTRGGCFNIHVHTCERKWTWRKEKKNGLKNESYSL